MARKEASIYKRKDGRWEARYVKEIGVDGKKRYGSVYGKSYTEAQQRRFAIIQDTRMHGATSFSLILSDIMWEWLQSMKNNIKPNTYQKYDGIIKNHVEPCSIGKSNIRFLTSSSLSSFADKKIAAGLSAKTVNDILIVIGLALNYAEEVYHIPKIKISTIITTRCSAIITSWHRSRICSTNGTPVIQARKFALFSKRKLSEVNAWGQPFHTVTAVTLTVEKNVIC